jgi:hypothetical protein
MKTASDHGNGPCPALGILLLDNASVRLPGAMSHPATFGYPTRFREVPGASVERVLRGDPAVAAYVETGRALADEGVAAITTNCGFSVVYQAELSAALPVPVATSSLLLLPFLARVVRRGGGLGVVTYEARSLTAAHLAAAGIADAALPVAIAGIDGTDTWAEMARPGPKVSVEALERDVLGVVDRMLGEHPEIQLILLECAGFPAVTAAVRARTQRPVFDFVTLANLLMTSVTGLPASTPGEAAPSGRR